MFESNLERRKTESDEQFRHRLLDNKVQQLAEMVQTFANKRPAVDPRADVPKPVEFAMSFYVAASERQFPQAVKSVGGNIEEIKREIMAEESNALAAACNLLADYFDRSNHSLQEQKERSDKRRKGKLPK